MNFKIEVAKNGENTLLVNGKYLYSKYNPSLDAEKMIDSEFNSHSKGFILIGLGLGYHLKHLLKRASKKNIFILLLYNKELEIFTKHSPLKNEIIFNEYVTIINNVKTKNFSGYQVILPNVWLKAISDQHPLFTMLEDIKIRQMSYKSTSTLLEQNIIKNIQNDNFYVNHLKNIFINKKACLVSSGPSLKETVHLIKKSKDKFFVLCVGSALKVLLTESIIPDAVIITDPSINTVKQIKGKGYNGQLFYLSTANHEMTKIHKGLKIILFQEGYGRAEDYAKKIACPLLETGGSVATTAISLIEFLGFSELYLFGQDLAFKENMTHSESSTSGIKVISNFDFRKTLSNNGQYVNTTSNLSTYRRWIERKAGQKSLKIFNTAKNGAKIENVPLIAEKEFLNKLEDVSSYNFTKVIDNKLEKKGEFNGK